ncbi:MAG: TRAP transporter substrate-binding protein [Elusimicrobiota bacterium]|nr:TRAP transporter substrate-binding protein [Elusimicrobiota bacterium]
MKVHRLVIASLLLLAAGAPASAEKRNIKWMIGHVNLDYFDEAAKAFKGTVEAASNGEVTVDIVTADAEALNLSSDGRVDAAIAAVVGSGEAEMGHSFADVMGAADPRLMAFEAPYLFRGYRHMEGVIEGPVGAELLGGMRAKGVAGLAFTYSGGANGVATVDREIRGPGDLKGLKVGVFGDEVDGAWLKALGATPVPIRHAVNDIVTMADQGKLDAVVITWRNFERGGLDRKFKYFNMEGASYLVSVTYASEKFLKGLSPDMRAVINQAAHESSAIERAKTIQLNERAKRQMLAKGVRPVRLTAAARKAFAEALRPAYEGTIDGLLGRPLIERIEKAPDHRIHPVMREDLAQR